jgi:hypothetical protein
MKALLILLLALLLFTAGAGILVVRDGTEAVGGPVYPVSQVMAGLAHQPGQWIGRTVRVRGVLGPVLCPSRICRWPAGRHVAGVRLARALLQSGGLVELYDPAAVAGPVTTTLLLTWSPRPSWLAELGSVPLLQPLVPPAQSFDWAATAVYRVRLEEDWTGVCCQGVVLNAQP